MSVVYSVCHITCHVIVISVRCRVCHIYGAAQKVFSVSYHMPCDCHVCRVYCVSFRAPPRTPLCVCARERVCLCMCVCVCVCACASLLFSLQYVLCIVCIICRVPPRVSHASFCFSCCPSAQGVDTLRVCRCASCLARECVVVHTYMLQHSHLYVYMP